MGLRRVRIKVTVFLEFWGRGSPEILHIQFVGKRFRSTELVKGVTLVCAQFSALGACERFGESERETDECALLSFDTTWDPKTLSFSTKLVAQRFSTGVVREFLKHARSIQSGALTSFPSDCQMKNDNDRHNNSCPV